MDISKSAIGSFQSPERLELLNDIDKFRQHGLHNLPQIVVCGDTSSGKSSVLGALSGIDFPVSGTICTRFATEIALRYSAAESVTGHAFITAAETASESHKSKVESFRREINSLEGIPALMDDARKQMGLPEVSGISRDVLHLRLEGRELPNLTLVDLPGLIHASRNTDDIVKVKGLVEDYFRQKESIILIVVSAENVIDNQGILTSSREFDPKGVRSIGVITKPDVLERPDKASLKPAIMELARNQNTSYQFTRGWHVVRCLNDKERTDGLDRDIVESHLFGQEQWKNVLQPKQLGMKSLRSNLSKYLHQHILQVLPELQKSLETEVKETKTSIELLGESRTTSDQRLVYLTRISRHYGKIVRDALEGNYSDAFFQDGDPVKRLRARTMALTEEYEELMRSQGHSFYISQDQSPVGETTSHSPEAITPSDALLKVEKLLNEHRGPELSFLFNPRLVGVLFNEQSRKWPVLTESYTSQITKVVQAFLRKVLDFLCPSQGDTSYLIYHHILEDTIGSKIDSLESKNRELFEPYRRSFLFSTKRRLQESLKRIEDEAFLQENDETGIQQRETPGPEIMGSDHDTRVKLLQYSEAYYHVAIENFIDNVVVLGVESCLLSKLESMFTLETVLEMNEETRNLAGGESADTQSEREALNARLATLEKALKRCRTHTSRYNYHASQYIAQLPQPASERSISKIGGEAHQPKNGHVQRDILIPKSHAQDSSLSTSATIPTSKLFSSTKFTIPESSSFADTNDTNSDPPHGIFASTKNTATATPTLPSKNTASTSSPFSTTKSTSATATPTRAFRKPLTTEKAVPVGGSSLSPLPSLSATNGFSTSASVGTDVPSFSFAKPPFLDQPREDGFSFGTKRTFGEQVQDTLFTASARAIYLPKQSPPSSPRSHLPGQVQTLLVNCVDMVGDEVEQGGKNGLSVLRHPRLQFSDWYSNRTFNGKPKVTEYLQCHPDYVFYKTFEKGSGLSPEETRWRDYQLMFHPETRRFVRAEQSRERLDANVFDIGLVKYTDYLEYLRSAIVRCEREMARGLRGISNLDIDLGGSDAESSEGEELE